MGGKRKSEDKEERIRRKIRKLEEKLRKNCNKRRVILSSESEELDHAEDMPDMDYEDEQQTDQSPPRLPSVVVNIQPTTSTSPQHGACESATPNPIECTPAEQLDIAVPSVSTPDNTEDGNIDIVLDSDILSLLGDAPKSDTPLGKPIHKDVAGRWQDILEKGLQKEVKDKILSEYPYPLNCTLLVPPILNPEVKAALAESQIKRDFYLLIKQKQIGTAISALTQATESIINRTTSIDKLLKPISDACRLLCDTHYNETRIRRNLIISLINPNLKDTLTESVRDKYLFGENISEKLRNAKTIQQSGQSLVIKKSNFTFNKNPNLKTNTNVRLNFKALHRRSATNQDVGRYRSPAIPSTSTAGQRPPRRTYNRHQAAERSPPPSTAARRTYRK